MGTHLSRAYRSPHSSLHREKSVSADSTNPSPKHKQRKEKKPKTLHRHHTVAQIHGNHGPGASHPTLFRHASYGDFRHHFHDEFRSVSKRFTQALGRTESMPRECREVVIYKTDFQTKYYCNLSSPLSHGRYATVTAAESCLTAQSVAVKIIRKDKVRPLNSRPSLETTLSLSSLSFLWGSLHFLLDVL